jgi:endonuclease YncB( thermonuclease family)
MILERSNGPAFGGLRLLMLVFAGGLITGAAGVGLGPHLRRPAEAPVLELPAPVRPTEPLRPGAALGPVYPADLVRVVDGDTFEARVHVWPGLEVTTRVRLRGIDAPELRGRCPQEQRQAEQARDALAKVLSGRDIRVTAVVLDKYGGRVLASVSARDAPDVSAALLTAGQARAYGGGRREGWCGIAARG